ncbi:hypothetical protein [Alistipes putredinis]|jgi:hypothetical protein bacD2_23304|uniref:hypothetical protein n=1 Tax=Alistipes putredinis TaxID=28117 RepID=UPI0020620BC3|nr:MAG TPA: ASCH domain protein [Caudoviricetes sp.]DAZ57239.1 MAG TPA: ASCH domain protein [Caudoviricetes sp.]
MQKIMFNDRYGLTNAVIEGRKTMTRRLIPDEFFGLTWDTRGNTLVYENEYGDFIDVRHSKYTRYKLGEVVAVSQCYNDVVQEFTDLAFVPGSTNKMFVRADLMPHQIRITGIRCERLQDISDEDCVKEGVRVGSQALEYPYYFIDTKQFLICDYKSPRRAFAALIDKVSGRGTWDRNPWVVAYEFELVK